jgi:hypothetical protein
MSETCFRDTPTSEHHAKRASTLPTHDTREMPDPTCVSTTVEKLQAPTCQVIPRHHMPGRDKHDFFT